MITREQYNEALDIVEEYQKQLFLNNKQPRTLIPKWCAKNNPSLRLCNILERGFCYYNDNNEFESIERITEHAFRQIRGGGTKSWKEFQELRGY